MQVSVEKLDDFGRRLKVVLPGERYTQGIHARIRELSKSLNLKGFRQGKVPPMVIEQRFGRQIRDEVSSELIRESLSEVVREQKLRPAMAPSIATEGELGGAEFAYTATFDVLPDFGAIDVSDLVIERESASVGEADIDRMIDTLRRQRIRFEPAGRPAAAGDFVAFHFVIQAGETRIPAEGSERGVTAIGQGAVLPEIEQGLIGMQDGETRTIEAVFPGDYQEPSLAGKSATIELGVDRVNAGMLPEIDEAFVRSFNIDGDIEAFRREVRQNLERELGQALSARLRTAVVEQLVRKYDTSPVPASLVEREAQALQQQARSELAERARRSGQAEAQVPDLDVFRDAARRRVLAGLLLNEIATQNALMLDDGRVREALAMIASTYENPAEVLALYRQDERLLNGLRSRVMDEQVAEWVAGRCQSSTVERGFLEILQPGGAPVQA